MKKTCIFLGFALAAVCSWVPVNSTPCEVSPTFLNGKCKAEYIEGHAYYYCGSPIATEKPNCTAYVQ